MSVSNMDEEREERKERHDMSGWGKKKDKR
jgi:hypothetical protein